MSRLSDDEKRYFTDQISMLKGENERLTKCNEELEARIEDEEGLKMQAVQEWNNLEAENKALRKWIGEDGLVEMAVAQLTPDVVDALLTEEAKG